MGGMVFDRRTGVLILPTDGVYYIYSHVQFQVHNTSKTYEAAVRMVACIPGIKCVPLEKHSTEPVLVESSTTVTHQQNRFEFGPDNGDNGIYQGGVFHLPAGTKINMIVRDPKSHLPGFKEKMAPNSDHLLTSKLGRNSYMGAFMVQELAFSI